MKVLIAGEYSGTIRDAFIAKGHNAISCDLLPTEKDGPHIQDDVLKHLNENFDMMIGHPPCTHIAVSGARHFSKKHKDGRQQEAIEFFIKLVNAPITHIAIENPVGIMSTIYRPPDQIIQPWMFGDEVQKTTCLWLKNLPLLKPTHIVSKGKLTVAKSGAVSSEWSSKTFNLPYEIRGHERSRTFQGIANAMAEQWNEPFPKQKILEEILT